MSIDKQYLTPLEVARVLRLNLLTIYKYIRDKKIVAIRLGRTYRIAKEDLGRYVEANKTYNEVSLKD